MKRKTIYEIVNSTTELGVTLPINAIVQNIDTKEVFSLNEKALSTDTLDDLSKTSFGGNAIVYPIIYANSDVLSEGDGSYEKPYKTLSNLVSSVEPVYDTENAALVSGSNILTIDTTSIDLKKGDKIISSYLPYNTYVTDFNATTITVSNAATSTGTYSIFFMREYLVKAFGTFNIDSSIEKDGLFWDFNGATCIIGNATAFNITSVKNSDFVVRGGKWLGVHANSKVYNNTATQNSSHYLYFFPNKVDSIGTGYVLESPWLYCGNVRIDSENGIYAKAGALCWLINYSAIIQGYKYSLFMGVRLGGTNNQIGIVDGITETPAAVYAIYNQSNAYTMIVNGLVKGSIGSEDYSNITINADVYGTNINLGICDKCEISGNTYITTGTIKARGTFIHKGMATGDWTVTNYGGGPSVIFENLAGSISISSGSNNRVRMCNTWGGYNNGNITLTNSAQLVLEQSQVISEYNYTTLSIASGCTLINKGYFRGKWTTAMAGNIINEGEMYLVDLALANSTITGNFIQKSNGKLYFRASGDRYTDVNYSSKLFLKDGSKCYLEGFLDASLLSTFAAIKKDATSTLVFDNARIKMYSGKPLIQCTSDVAGSKDIYIFGSCITDADGTTYGLLFPFDGSSYAPNAVIQQQLTESTSLTNIL